ncbi:MAG: hypothetical protein PWP65_1409 [Clostridia bacterium]|nr:hypothetical protein [Clostridia bacterium]
MDNAKLLADLRLEMVTVCQKIFNRGLTSATSGNLSARLPGRPEQVLIKRTGKSFGDVHPEDFLLVDLEGNVLEGEGKPSKELFFHLAIYRRRPEVNAVLHGHSPYTTAYVLAKGELPLVTVAAELSLVKVPVVGYAPPGSQELAGMVGTAFEEPGVKAAVLLRHGYITVGQDCHGAFYLADVLEDNAKTAFLLAQLSR